MIRLLFLCGLCIALLAVLIVLRKKQQEHPLGITILHQQPFSTKDKFVVFRWDNIEYLCIVCPGQYCYKVDQRTCKGPAPCQDKEKFNEIFQEESGIISHN